MEREYIFLRPPPRHSVCTDGDFQCAKNYFKVCEISINLKCLDVFMGAVKSTEVDTAMIVESIQVLYKYRKYPKK